MYDILGLLGSSLGIQDHDTRSRGAHAATTESEREHGCSRLYTLSLLTQNSHTTLSYRYALHDAHSAVSVTLSE